VRATTVNSLLTKSRKYFKTEVQLVIKAQKIMSSRSNKKKTPSSIMRVADPAGGDVVIVPNGNVPGSGSLPTNKSDQKLVNEDYLDNAVSRSSQSSSSSSVVQRTMSADASANRRTKITSAQWLTVFVLCYVNLINYMDRFTLAGKSTL
jgi:hypothetical protein